jgi:thiamine pyrophosphate-dependent acetolactate synthase large subunit-like protein
MPDRIDGGEALLSALRALGIEHVFSSPGSEWAPVWEALARQRRDGVDGPAYHDLTHETLAAGMATGYALAARRIAAVLLHAAPGLLQGACAIHGALLSGAPMLVCSSESITFGEGDGPDPGAQWYRNLSIVGGPQAMAAPFVKWANQAPSAQLVYEMVLRTAEMAQRAPAGPVYLNVPLEALLAPWQPPAIRKPVARPGARVSPPADIDSLARALAQARNPVVITESAGRDPEAFHALVALCEALGIGVIEPPSAVCANFPKDHPLHIGPDVSAAAEADLVLLVACRAPWYPPSASAVPGAEIVVIDEVPQRPHMVYQVLGADRYLEGDVAATLQSLRTAVDDRTDAETVRDRGARWGAVHAEQRAGADADEERALGVVDRITPVLLARTLREELGTDAVYVDETITHSRLLQRHLRWTGPDRWFYVQGGLGQGTAVALGVMLTIGDGSFLYNPIVQALMASRELRLPLLIVVFNNRQYLSMKLNHLRFYPDGAAVDEGDFDGVDLSGQPPLSELGRPFGLPGWEVVTPADLTPALRAAAAAVAGGETAIVNVTLRQAQ